MDCHNELVFIFVIIDWTVEYGIILTSNTSEQISGAVLNINTCFFAQFVGEPFLIGWDWFLLSRVKPPLIVHSHILYLGTSNGIMMLHNGQSIIEPEAGIVNFLDILLCGVLVNL